MKRTTRNHSDKWSGYIFTDTDDPRPPHDVDPPPEPPYSPEPPVYTDIDLDRATAIYI